MLISFTQGFAPGSQERARTSQKLAWSLSRLLRKASPGTLRRQMPSQPAESTSFPVPRAGRRRRAA